MGLNITDEKSIYTVPDEIMRDLELIDEDPDKAIEAFRQLLSNCITSKNTVRRDSSSYLLFEFFDKNGKATNLPYILRNIRRYLDNLEFISSCSESSTIN